MAQDKQLADSDRTFLAHIEAAGRWTEMLDRFDELITDDPAPTSNAAAWRCVREEFAGRIANSNEKMQVPSSDELIWNSLIEHSRNNASEDENVLDWVYENQWIAPEDISPESVPSPGALGLLRWVRTPEGQREFYKHRLAILAKRAEVKAKQEDDWRDEKIESDKLLEMINRAKDECFNNPYHR